MRPQIRSGDFEQLIVWQKSAVIAELIHEITSQGDISKDYWFKNQIRSAGISISSNIAEGYGRYSDKEFMRFLSIANGSTYEVRSQVLIAQRLRYVADDNAQKITNMCLEVSRMIEGLRKTIARKTKK